jgi:NADP-reducing hydrogenase subunit HndC
VFALAGKVNNTGLVEVPMGTTLREVIFEIGGGIPDGKAFKAAQTGGPSGGCIPAAHLDLPLEYDSLQQIGSIMGSGGLVVMDEDSCMVDVAKFFMDFCVDESCGKCPPCRVGTKQIYKTLHKICEGKGNEEDLARLDDLCDLLRSSSLCGLGQTSPNPTMSTLRHFRAEYEAHIKNHKCPAKVCKSLITYQITQTACTGCSLCARNCPTSAISRVEGQKKYKIDQAKCIHCGKCFEVCNFSAVARD